MGRHAPTPMGRPDNTIAELSMSKGAKMLAALVAVAAAFLGFMAWLAGVR